MNNVLYIIWWEGIKKNGLVENVVYRQLEELSDRKENNIYFLTGGCFWKGTIFRTLQRLPILNTFVRERQNNWINPSDLKDRFLKKGVKCFFAQSVGNPKSVYLNFIQLILYPFPHLWKVHFIHKKYQINIIHCRSYFPAWVTLLSRSLFKDNYAIIFDPRGILPEEGVATNYLKPNGLSYKLWKWVEKKLLIHADEVTVLNENFRKHLLPIRGSRPMRVIYIPVDLSPFNNSSDKPSGAPPPTLAYLGSISSDGWNSIEYLVKYFNYFCNFFPNALLLIISPAHHRYILNKLIELGIKKECILIDSAFTINDVADKLRSATYACLPFREIRHPFDMVVGYTKISCKLCEYLAAGLPVICNETSGGDADFIRQHNVGNVLSIDNLQNTSHITFPLSLESDTIRKRCQDAAKLFEMSVIAKQVTCLYEDVSSRFNDKTPNLL